MRNNTKFTVAVHILLLIASSREQKMTSKLLSDSTGANPVMIRTLFGKLKSAGLLEVSPGKGVTQLAKSPEQLSLWDIYLAVEEHNMDDIFIYHPNISEDNPESRLFRQVLSSHLDEAIRILEKKLETITLQILLDEFQNQ